MKDLIDTKLPIIRAWCLIIIIIVFAIIYRISFDNNTGYRLLPQDEKLYVKECMLIDGTLSLNQCRDLYVLENSFEDVEILSSTTTKIDGFQMMFGSR